MSNAKHEPSHGNREYEAYLVARAFRSEIWTLLDLVRQGNYISGLKSAIFLTDANEAHVEVFSPNLNIECFSVFDRLIGKIGLLRGTLPENTIAFYNQLRCRLDDFRTINANHEQYMSLPEDQRLARFELYRYKALSTQQLMYQRMLAVSSLGQEVIAQIDSVYSKQEEK